MKYGQGNSRRKYWIWKFYSWLDELIFRISFSSSINDGDLCDEETYRALELVVRYNYNRR